MTLQLLRTEYNMECVGTYVKILMAFQEGKAQIDVFLDGALAYYYVIEDFEELCQDDQELIRLVMEKIKTERIRWVRDCTILEDHAAKLILQDKVTVYTATVQEMNLYLKVSTIDNDGKNYVFRLEYTNNENDDILTCTMKAKNHDDLLKKISMYAKTISDISGMFMVNQNELANNAFSKCFRW